MGESRASVTILGLMTFLWLILACRVFKVQKVFLGAGESRYKREMLVKLQVSAANIENAKQGALFTSLVVGYSYEANESSMNLLPE